MRALVMAGGEGRRLYPLTANCPKPLLPIGDMPILEHVIVHLKRFGIDHVTLAVAHLAPMIEAFCGTGMHGVKVSYLHEDRPLGTGGAISLLHDCREPFFMMNGDILTDLDISAMFHEHLRQNAAITVATKCMYTDLSLGVLDVDNSNRVVGYREKPRLQHRFGIGMYIVEPAVRQFVPSDQRTDMPDLINLLIRSGHVVASYDHTGRWTDIGTPGEYNKADSEVRAAVAGVCGGSLVLTTASGALRNSSE